MPVERRSSVVVRRAVRSSLPRQEHISLPGGGFARVYRTGFRTRKGSILVIEAPGEHAEATPRVGVVAGRKVGHAVQRNRAKRRLREAVRRCPPDPGLDVVITALDDLSDVPFDQLCGDIAAAFEAGRMKRAPR